MIYQLWQAQQDFQFPMRALAETTGRMLRQWEPVTAAMPLAAPFIRSASAAMELIAHARTTHTRPAYAFTTVQVGNREVEVTEEVVDETPFGTLLRFAKDTPVQQPRVLVVAPMSGHFSTLLRGTVEVLLADHDVYITDWVNARDIPLSAGTFGFDDFTDHIIRFLEVMGPGSHVLAVCQPAPATLAAVAVMAEARNRCVPATMTLMAGPIDTRISPTQVNELANSKPIGWFERNLIGTVPARYAGAGRRVYPGAIQLQAFMSMNLDRHMKAHRTQFENIVSGKLEAAAAHRRFYDEYFAVMDLPAEYYLETVQRVFQDHDLPRGVLMHRGRPVRPEAIRRTALLTVEGERDDICAIGQTMAALDLCPNIPLAMRHHHLQTGAGHYGVFSGRRWANEVYPKVRAMIEAHS
ncbi:polyhydroxyalkanoate depolymerase, intracellular [Roseomonas rosea]|uniref:Polyhydroxyalkanoate depolymerase, intracellular n=1 Tax=Muricoccus roseus TaxID=198092 RepID=A0A1M6EBZ3_9PROT|nr:polyhydroxyalkanoate depolymerase [Roseomonas rosea]SHI82994.1 polyhydroxyalkanoate depolymerase, intracellular [Roseomonas rosea]